MSMSRPVPPSACQESRYQAEAQLGGATSLFRTARPHADGTRTADPEFRAEVQKFLDGLVSTTCRDGQLVVAHAGMKAEMQDAGRPRCGLRSFRLNDR